MVIAKLLACALSWPLLVTRALEDVMPADDECASPECALQALQSRAKTVKQGSDEGVSVGFAAVPGVFDDDIDGLLPDPDETEGDEEDTEDEEPAGPGLCGGQTYDHSKEGCCGNVLFDLTTQSCCGTDIFEIKGEDCCNQTEVYNTTAQGCCNHKHIFNLGEEFPHCVRMIFFVRSKVSREAFTDAEQKS